MRSAGRVGAGVARGLRLEGPGAEVRPLSDRVKQSLFGSLAARLEGARVLDLFAGSGAAGIEALSRGAAWCDFVERDEAAVASIRSNLQRTGLAARAAIHQADVLRFLGQRRADPGRFDLVLLDPPYGDPVMLAALGVLGGGTHLTPEGIVVAKHFWRDPLPDEVGGLRRQRMRRFGETALSFYGRDGEAGARP